MREENATAGKEKTGAKVEHGFPRASPVLMGRGSVPCDGGTESRALGCAMILGVDRMIDSPDECFIHEVLADWKEVD